MTGLFPSLRATADAYDAVAIRYAELVRDGLDNLPLDRATLAAFAEYTPTAVRITLCFSYTAVCISRIRRSILSAENVSGTSICIEPFHASGP